MIISKYYTVDEFKESLTHYSSYPLIFVNDRGEVICEKCAKNADINDLYENYSVDIYYEGAPIYCDSCNDEIESAYGDPYGDDKND